ncbi:MAG: hypothetical protein V2J51_11485, partial [Erythrobacter sp.]|nr:hypothetical protein [Erythrobacter sp.]
SDETLERQLSGLSSPDFMAALGRFADQQLTLIAARRLRGRLLTVRFRGPGVVMLTFGRTNDCVLRQIGHSKRIQKSLESAVYPSIVPDTAIALARPDAESNLD